MISQIAVKNVTFQIVSQNGMNWNPDLMTHAMKKQKRMDNATMMESIQNTVGLKTMMNWIR